jgi:23S rRNA (guanine745-N1)-methyltransferase
VPDPPLPDPTAPDPTVPDQAARPAFAAGVLRCPQHGRASGASAPDTQALRLEGRSLICGTGHRFDLAAQGYVNLLGRAAPAAADTAAMVAARVEVQAAGIHAELTATLAAATARVIGGGAPSCVGSDDAASTTAVGPPAPPLLVDLGAGTGHHLAGVLHALATPHGAPATAPDRAAKEAPIGIALDISKYAGRRAARAHPRIGAVVADVWGPLPLGDACADVVLTVFAPRNRIEVARILRPGGHLVVVTPDPEHLQPLVDRLGLLQVGDDKLDRLDAELDGVATRVGRGVVRTTHQLDHRLVRAVATMGPSAHHLDAVELDRRIAALPEPIEVSQAVVVSTYRRDRPGRAARYLPAS